MLRISKAGTCFTTLPISFRKSNILHIGSGDKFRLVLLIAWHKICNGMDNELWQMIFWFSIQ